LAVVAIGLVGLGGHPEQALSQTFEPVPGPPVSTAPEEPTFAPDRILVKVKDEVPVEAVDALNRKNNARTEKRIPRTRVNVVGLPKGLSVREAVRRYEASPDIEYAEPDYQLYATQSSPTPSDTDYPKLYGLNNTGQTGGAADADIDAPEAWGVTSGDANTVVAVIDTGVDINHPDLRDNIWVNPGESGPDILGKDKATNGIDDDDNGYVDDVNGWDFRNNNNSVFDADEGTHGTHVAGSIAAKGNNSLGVTGTAWEASIMPLKFIGPETGYTSDAVEALNYAVANGARISNNSWGGGGYSQLLRDAINKADTVGHLFVAAAGNNGADNDATTFYPASYSSPNIISVAATDRNDALASFSNYGATSVDLAAPGVSILSTMPGNTYGYKSGTSMATPHVSGIAALMKSERPGLDDAELKAQILQFAEKKPSLSGKMVTAGRANAAASLKQQAMPDTTAPNTGISSGPSGTVRSNSASFAFVASEPSQFKCSLDGAAFSDCASPKSYFSLASRSHTFRVAAVDAAGNVDPTPAVRTWTVDTIRPGVTYPRPVVNSKTRDRTPAISAIVRDSQTNLAKGNIKLFVDGKRIAASAFSYNRSTDKLSYTSRRLSYARHTVKVVARDAAGNTVSRSWRFYVVK
jgi:subtilisin family serine protease